MPEPSLVPEVQATEAPAVSAREMAHRINNTLAVVQSIISQTGRVTPDPKAFGEAINRRIAAMASANRLLAGGNWDRADLESLLRQQFSAQGIAEARIRLQGPKTALPSRNIVAFGLIVHELADNAVKFGALSNEAGHVDLVWETAPRDGRSWLTLDWRETGGPPVGEPARKGFGSALLDRGVDDCKVSRTFDPAGLSCRIELPL